MFYSCLLWPFIPFNSSLKGIIFFWFSRDRINKWCLFFLRELCVWYSLSHIPPWHSNLSFHLFSIQFYLCVMYDIYILLCMLLIILWKMYNNVLFIVCGIFSKGCIFIYVEIYTVFWLSSKVFLIFSCTLFLNIWITKVYPCSGFPSTHMCFLHVCFIYI